MAFAIKRLLFLFAFLSGGIIYAQNSESIEFKAILDTIKASNIRTDFRKVEALILKAESLYKPDLSLELQIQYFYNRADYHMETGSFKETEQSYLIADSLSSLEGSGFLQLQVWSGLGNLYARLGEYRKAVQFQNKVLDFMVIEEGDSSGYYSTLVNLSNSYEALGKSDQALELLIQSRNYFRTHQDSLILAITLNNIGEVYRKDFLDYREAIDHYLEAMRINQLYENIRDLLSNYNNLALAYRHYGMLDSALFYGKLNERYRREYNDKGGLAQALYTLGTVYFSQGDYLMARGKLNRAYNICDSLDIHIGKLSILKHLAEVDTAQADLKSAIQKLEQAIAINDARVASMEEALSLNQALSSVYRKQGNFEKAFNYLQKAKSIEDSIFINQNRIELSLMRSEYEKELALGENELLKTKEKAQIDRLQAIRMGFLAIAIVSLALLILSVRLFRISDSRKKALNQLRKTEQQLRTEIENVAQKTEELEQANSAKNQILSVMGHDLRSPLVGLSSLLGTVSAEEITREELQELLKMLKTETDRSLISLQNVLNWARLQMEDIRIFQSELNLEELVKEIILMYGPGGRSKQIKIQFENRMEGKLWADEHQFRSMCGNLLSNAIKFSPAKATIKIIAQRTGKDAIVSVCDEGPGLSQEILNQLNEHKDRLNSSAGTAGERGTGIGLRIVQDFITIHKGRLLFENRPEGGTKASLIFPLRSKLENT